MRGDGIRETGLRAVGGRAVGDETPTLIVQKGDDIVGV